ncbi:DEAD/DEAH box helicase [Afifella sp. IM 167]|uniref:DEAD/DEAH box helicase n=1 Tax=Afifella sp. IM 167 TaxID=2033586 RepID=UPI001CCC35E0|nr:DEAD/DEAH box helicase [Afifella sp. IM 167]MBZ8133834.1 RNA helicase [Afifella sp. IM 167]
MIRFDELGLNPSVLKSVAALGFETPTPIQAEAIPHVLSGRDLMGLAQTGTGKTAAFGLPLVHKLMEDHSRPRPREVSALILAPTRELVNQIASNLSDYVRGTRISVEIVVGGASIGNQIRRLKHGTDILVATPGRLLDLVERRAVDLKSARFLVLDEADQMLDLGFIHALRRISKLVGTPRQTLLFSATMPKEIEELSRAYLSDPVQVEVAQRGRAADKVAQSVHFVSKADKPSLLKECLGERPDDLSLVFSRTKHGAEKLMKALVKEGFSAGSIHGNKSQSQRERAIRAFRQGDIRILVATDVAARGIDIPGVSHVYNFDLPEVPESYVHRIGRTARAGAEGEAVAFCSPEEFKLLRGIEKLTGIPIRIASGEAPAGGYRSSAGKPGGRSGNGQRNKSRGSVHANAAGGRGDAKKTHRQDPGRQQRSEQGQPSSGQRRRSRSRRSYEAA